MKLSKQTKLLCAGVALAALGFVTGKPDLAAQGVLSVYEIFAGEVGQNVGGGE